MIILIIFLVLFALFMCAVFVRWIYDAIKWCFTKPNKNVKHKFLI